MANELIIGQTLDFSSLVKMINIPNGTAAGDGVNFGQLSAVIGALVFQGGYNATTNTPDLVTPVAGVVDKGYMYVVTVAGTFFGEILEIGDTLISNINDPAGLSDWTILQTNIDSIGNTTYIYPDVATAVGSAIAEGDTAYIIDTDGLGNWSYSICTTAGLIGTTAVLDTILLEDQQHYQNTDTGTDQTTFEINSTAFSVILSSSEQTGDRTYTFYGERDGELAVRFLQTTASAGATPDYYDHLVVTNPSAADIPVDLPTAIGEGGAQLIISKAVSLGTVTLDGAGVETINGALTLVLNDINESVTIESDGANWNVISWVNRPTSSGGTVITAKAANYTAVANDFVLMTTGATDKTITLPAAAANTNSIIEVKKIDSAVGNVIIDGNGAETIDGALTKTISLQYDSVTIQSDGTSWWIK